MVVYIATFAVSTVIFKLADYVKKEQRIYIDAIAILLLCLLAGFRAESIGTDTHGYIRPMIDRAISSTSLLDFMRSGWSNGNNFFIRLMVSDYEIGYVLIVWLISSVFKSVIVTQTFLELLVIVPVYIALRTKGDVPIWFGMFVFMGQFFNGSMNLIRQSIAMAFVLLAVAYWMQREKRKYILLMILAVLFHTTALLGIALVFIYEYVGKEKKMNLKTSMKSINVNYINMLIVIVGGITVLTGTQIVIDILDRYGLSKYIGYIMGNIHFMPNQIINILPAFIMLLLSFKYFENAKSEWAFYIVMLIYVMVAGQFTSVNGFGGRIGLYFKIFAIFAYPLICKYSRYKRTSKIIMISYLIFYWWFYYVLMQTDATVPYSMIQ